MSTIPQPSLFDGDTCTRCGQWKPDDQFIKSKKPRWCKGCKSASDRDYYQRNAGKVKAQVRAYAAANPDKVEAYRQSQQGKARQRRYDESRKEQRREYYASEAGRESQKRGQQKFNQTERGKARNRLNQHNRRVAGTLTPAQWLEILDAYERTCAYCGVAGVPLQLDHVLPVSRGGETTRENIVPACETCNKRKQANLWTPRPPTRPLE